MGPHETGKLPSNIGLISKIYKELKKLTTKNQTTQSNMGYRSKPRIHNRGILNGWEASKEMLKVLSDQRKANQNDSEITLRLPYSNKND